MDLAAECLDHLLAEEPDNAHIWNSRAICLAATGRHDEAIPCFAEAARLEPSNAPFQQNLGQALLDAGNWSEAAEAFKRALLLDPGSAAAQEGLAAATAHTSTETAEPADALSKDERLDVVFSLYDAYRIEEASREVDQLLEEGHVTPMALLLKGMILALQGLHDQAQSYIWKAIDLDPSSGQSYFYLMQSLKVDESHRPLVHKMEELAAAGKGSDWDRTLIQFAIGIAYDRLREYELAMQWLNKANALAKRVFQLEFDREDLVQDVDDLIATFSRERLNAHHEYEIDSDLPLLIVGMPRSGTTLTEGILSRHPRVAAAGELRFWGNEMAKAFTSRARVVHEKEAKTLGEEYLRILRSYGPDADRVVDKNPYNFLRVGLIASVFPKARFIHCKRNAVDSCLSFYMTCFKSPPSYSFDKSAIVFYYRQYERLTEHWKQVLGPDRWLEVQYEELIADQETVVRRLLNYCGLEWNETCMQPQDSDRVITSTSHWQAKQPVYKTSVERWRNYEPWLGEFAELLKQ